VALVALTLPLLGAQNCGVPVKDTTKLPPEQVLPLQTATLEELLARLTELTTGVLTLNAVTELAPSTGSAYSGVIEQYRDVRAFVLARRLPLEITINDEVTQVFSARQVRLIGQAPVVRKNIFDMAADESRFRIFLPTKNQFIVGPTRLTQRREKPIENLRPQHLFEALFPERPDPDGLHLLEENEFGGIRYYAVSEVVELRRLPYKYGRPAAEPGARIPGTAEEQAPKLKLLRKWWFDRRGLELVRVQHFDGDGKLLSDIRYADWRTEGAAPYPWQITLGRPQEDYQLKLIVKELTLNEALPATAFELEPPEKVELIDVEKDEGARGVEKPEEETP